MIAFWVATAGGAKDAAIEDFLLRFDGDEEDDEESGQTWEQQLMIMEAMAARTAAQRAIEHVSGQRESHA